VEVFDLHITQPSRYKKSDYIRQHYDLTMLMIHIYVTTTCSFN